MSQAQVDAFADLVVAITELEESVRRYVNTPEVRQDFAEVKIDLAELRDTLHYEEPTTKPMPTLKELLNAIGDTPITKESILALWPEEKGPETDPYPAPAEPTPAPGTPEPAPEPTPETPPTPANEPVPA